MHVIGQFPQIQTKKIKVVHFVWKLAHMVSWRYILILDSGLDFWNHNHKIHFGVNLGWKSQSWPFYLIIGIYTRYFKDADSYSDISFLNFQPYIHFWANLGWKNLTCLFCLKAGTYIWYLGQALAWCPCCQPHKSRKKRLRQAMKSSPKGKAVWTDIACAKF